MEPRKRITTEDYHKPVSIHSRYAWRDALTLVQEAQLEKVVFHWYTGTSSVLRDIVSQGYFISATPAVVPISRRS
jgi:TatD DNase family protein